MPAAVPPAVALTPSVFVALSASLTGVSAAELGSATGPLGVAGRHHATLAAAVPAATLDRLASVFFAAPTPAEGSAAVLADAELGPVARSIIELWRLGSWQAAGKPALPVNVASTHGYKESLVRRALQSRPIA